jgi:hypothetical protein
MAITVWDELDELDKFGVQAVERQCRDNVCGKHGEKYHGESSGFNMKIRDFVSWPIVNIDELYQARVYPEKSTEKAERMLQDKKWLKLRGIILVYMFYTFTVIEMDVLVVHYLLFHIIIYTYIITYNWDTVTVVIWLSYDVNTLHPPFRIPRGHPTRQADCTQVCPSWHPPAAPAVFPKAEILEREYGHVRNIMGISILYNMGISIAILTTVTNHNKSKMKKNNILIIFYLLKDDCIILYIYIYVWANH